MMLLGIDPGATTGWCLYNTEQRRVEDCGDFRGTDLPDGCKAAAERCDHVIIESLHEPRGGIYPAVVVAGITQGHIERQLILYGVQRITRHEVKMLLTEAVHREPVVQKDKHAWEALLVLHGGDKAAKKGGPLHGVKSHQRAALAAVVAWCFKERLR
jgi:hypothetical protein